MKDAESTPTDPHGSEPMHVISLGAGVQSSALLLMAMEGEVTPTPEAAIFADTHNEPEEVYLHLWCLAQISPIPIYVVSAGDLEADVRQAVEVGGRSASLPYFTETGLFKKDGKPAEGRAIRQCTMEYKIAPIRRLVQKLRNGRPVVMWKGISLDETIRMGDSDVQYISHRYPLAIEKRMRREDCERWTAAHGYWPAPRSACVFCPFHGNEEWRAIQQRPREWAQAVAFDEATRVLPGMTKKTYLHRSLKPLPLVDLRSPSERGQESLFGEECSGTCGV